MIHNLAVNRTVHSAWTDGQDLRLMFTDATELTVSWGNTGPELKGKRLLCGLPAVPIVDGLVSRQLAGKTVDVVHTDDEGRLYIRTACGHEAMVEHFHDGPMLCSMSVRVTLPMVGVTGMFGRF